MEIEQVKYLLGAIFSFLFGASIGSFLNVCIYRLPLNKSLSSPPSHCPACNHRLGFLDLFPLLSYLFLRGKCRYCGVRITPRYFFVELITALLFLAFWHSACTRFTIEGIWTPAGLILLVGTVVWVSMMLVTFVIDWETTYVIDGVCWVAMVAGIITELSSKTLTGETIAWQGIQFLPAAVPGMIIGFLFFIGVDWLGRAIFHKDSMGLGDSFIGAAIGALLGPGKAMLVFGIAITLGAIVGIVMILGGSLKKSKSPASEEKAAAANAVSKQDKKKKKKGKPVPEVPEEEPEGYYMPFGPFLTAAAVAVAYAPEWAVRTVATFWQWWTNQMGG
ncbi:MAG: prepilin peptidase [bacterium]